MRKLLKLYSCRKLMLHFPQQNYCIYHHMRKNTRLFTRVFSAHHFTTVSSPENVTENCVDDLHKEFQEPKKILFQVLNEAFLRDQSLDLKPSIITEMISPDSGSKQVWKAKIEMKWPEAFVIEGLANRKTDALTICFVKVCHRLKQLGVLDQANKPLLRKQKISESDIKSAKGDLITVCQKIWHRTGDKDCMPKFNSALIQGLYGNYWQTELHLSYPEKKVFKGLALRSTSAECIAAYEALHWLISKGVINRKMRLVEYTKNDELQLTEIHQAPYSICIPPSLQQKMEAVLEDINNQRAHLSIKSAPQSPDLPENMYSKEQILRDIVTEKPYYKLTEQQFSDRSRYLYLSNKSKILERKISQKLEDVLAEKSCLPILPKKDDILKLIEENQVVVLSGDTGCGKSTQVPQIILNYYISNMKGAECNIIVTQPRRLSAVSLAERVAKERDEQVGNTVGYHIRLNRCTPQGNGAILYCTTGILLRKLLFNPTLEGISHIIIDEVHERNIEIDIILILLKDILESNKKLKVLLMSASFNTNLFAQYFNTSAVIHIPGKMFPVEEYFLEDLEDSIPSARNKGNGEASIDFDLIVDCINYIDTQEPPGAILCFLPGWHEIRTVQAKLLEKKENSQRLMICPVHSRLSHEEQKRIFFKPLEGQRKVILATNIAETSITINDIVYVVNSGLHKGTLLDMQVGLASLSTQWVTKANVRQRKGRAGRVQPGKCYHLFSWKTFMKMEEYPVPEIMRMPLESIILDCKLYCKEAKAEEFLSKGIQPPALAAVQNGVEELQMLGLLDEKENLTNLGNIIVHLSMHPRLSVAVVFAAFLGCLDPILTVCALLTLEKEPFLNTLDDQLQIRKIKEMHDNGLYSDHLALTKIYDTWNSLTEEAESCQYIEKNLLDDQTLLRIKQLKELFLEELYSSGLIRDTNSCSDDSAQLNIYNSHVPSILAALTTAFYPNIIKVLQGEINQGKINKNTLIYSIVKGQKAFLQKESIACNVEELPTPWLAYFSALKSEARRKAMVSAVSTIPGICLVLLAGRDLSKSEMVIENKVQENLAVLTIDHYSKLKFSCTESEANLLLDWRKCFFEIFQLYIKNLRENGEEREYMIFCLSKLIPVLKEIFETPQVPFTKGQTYEFINNELVTKEL